MSRLNLFLVFLYIGLFSVGGGLASIPLILQTVVRAGFISEELFYSMIAVSESTPGPIGVNLATYIGFEHYGVWGGITTTLGIVIPGFVISYLVSRVYGKVSETPLVKASFYGIRAVVVGLICTAAYGVLSITVFTFDAFAATGNILSVLNWKALAVFAVLLFLLFRFKKHPVLYILLGGVCGVLFFRQA